MAHPAGRRDNATAPLLGLDNHGGHGRSRRRSTEAKNAHVVGVLRLLKATNAFNGSAFPLDPGSARKRRHDAASDA
jgi:hypothetical protein